MIAVDEVPKLLVSDLKFELSKRGISPKGNTKNGTNLVDPITRGVPLVENLSKGKAANLTGDSFTPGAHWEELVCDGDFKEEVKYKR